MSKVLRTMLSLLLVFTLFVFAVPTFAEEAEIEECTITVLHFTGEDSGRLALQKVVDAFNEIYPQVTVELEFMPYADHVQTLTLRMAADEAPDVYECYETTMSTFINAGEAVNMADWEWTQHVSDNMLQKFRFNDGIYASGCLYSGNGIIYNKTIFDQYGLTAPATYDEFMNVCQTLSDNGVAPLTASFAQQNGPLNFFSAIYYPALYANGSDELTKLINKEMKWSDTVVFRKALEVYSGILEYIDPISFTTDLTTAYARVGLGEAAMMCVGPFASVDIKAAGPDNEYGCFILPWSNEASENYIRIGGGDAWLVSPKSKHPEAAKAFLNFWQGIDGQTIYANSTGTALSFVEGFTLETDNQVMLDNIDFINNGRAITAEDCGGQFTGEYQQVMVTLMQGWAAMSAEERMDLDARLAEFDAEWATIID